VIPTPNLPFPWGNRVPLSNTMLLETTEVSLPNGISFGPMALARCTSMTVDTHSGNICRNRRNCGQRRRPKIGYVCLIQTICTRDNYPQFHITPFDFKRLDRQDEWNKNNQKTRRRKVPPLENFPWASTHACTTFKRRTIKLGTSEAGVGLGRVQGEGYV